MILLPLSCSVICSFYFFISAQTGETWWQPTEALSHLNQSALSGWFGSLNLPRLLPLLVPVLFPLNPSMSVLMSRRMSTFSWTCIFTPIPVSLFNLLTGDCYCDDFLPATTIPSPARPSLKASDAGASDCPNKCHENVEYNVTTGKVSCCVPHKALPNMQAVAPPGHNGQSWAAG